MSVLSKVQLPPAGAIPHPIWSSNRGQAAERAGLMREAPEQGEERKGARAHARRNRSWARPPEARLVRPSKGAQKDSATKPTIAVIKAKCAVCAVAIIAMTRQ